MKGEIRIDLSRHLCDTCKKASNCEFDNYECGNKQNVVRCIKYQKTNENKLKKRVEKGDVFWYFVYVDEKDISLGVKAISKVETNDRIDNLLHEVGNYFYTEEECNEAILKLKK